MSVDWFTDGNNRRAAMRVYDYMMMGGSPPPWFRPGPLTEEGRVRLAETLADMCGNCDMRGHLDEVWAYIGRLFVTFGAPA